MSGYELYDFAPMDSADHLQNFLNSSKPGEEIMFDDYSSPEETLDSANTPPTYPYFPEPGTSLTQPQFGCNFIDLSSPTSSSQEPANPSTPDIAPVEVLNPPPFELRRIWLAQAASVLPRDILRRAPRKRGEGKYACSGMKYKPCTQEEFIAKVQEKVRSGKYKAPVAKRPRRQYAGETTSDQVVVALQAQAEIYGERFNGAANYFDWE